MSSNYSYWELTSFLSGYDVLVIGSGLVGLSAALHLKQTDKSLKIGVLEAGFLPSGASTKNAGFACFAGISEALDELETCSESDLVKIIEMRWKGFLKLRKRLGDKAIDFVQSAGYDLFSKDQNERAELCISRINYFNNITKEITGIPDNFSVANKKIKYFGFNNITNIIKNKSEGQIDTGKMMQALIQKVQSLGVQIFNNCAVLDIVQKSNIQVIKTTQGNFTSRKVIIATNAFSKQILPELDIIPGRGQVLITERIENLKVNGAFHYDKGFYYFRNINNRILLGGGRNINFKAEETTEVGLTSIVQESLEKLLYDVILPQQKVKIEHRWSGIMAFGNELKPIIKEVKPNLFCAVRCNGMGIAMGSLVGEEVANLALSNL
ncbi:MAG: FAD-dependent oxidoreductase [Sphingobacteriales bacterium]|nr:FAD-dependent oxidoreductase [Sphingobacteriales bacterium]